MFRTLAVLTLSLLSANAMAESPRAKVSGDRIVLNDKVFFEYDSAGIDRQSTPMLKELAVLLKNHPDIRVVEVRGHTDSQGSMAYNQELSTQRADEVARFLIDNGIAPGRVRTRGYGESRPLVDDSRPHADDINRRVEFVIVKKG